MATEWHVKPGGLTGLQARVGMAVAAAFLVFGLLLAVAVGGDVPESETGLRLALGGFLAVWVFGCVAIIVVLARVQAAARGAAGDTHLEVREAPRQAPGGAPRGRGP